MKLKWLDRLLATLPEETRDEIREQPRDLGWLDQLINDAKAQD